VIDGGVDCENPKNAETRISLGDSAYDFLFHYLPPAHRDPAFD
jgi:hypothetical protein